jgi:hypothetical protein
MASTAVRAPSLPDEAQVLQLRGGGITCVNGYTIMITSDDCGASA